MLRPSIRLLGVAFVLATIGPGAVHGSDCTVTSIGFVPLNDLGTGRHLGQFQGGLYPDGSNEMPAAHRMAGLAAAEAIVPRDATGAPDPTGKIVLISVGMSNTMMEFCATAAAPQCTPESFIERAAADPAVNHETLAIVNGAKGAEPAPNWLDPAGENYVRVAGLLAEQGLSEKQVQIAWVKLANPVPNTSLPAADADAYVLEAELGTIARALESRYPNLQQVFFSSRIYAGYATTDLNPEPYAYESGFAVKWLIEAQIHQMSSLGKPVDPIAGDLDYETVAPWMAWGPYFWADGTTPRSDGLFYACSDLLTDGTHPAKGATEKVSGLLLDFFLGSEETSSWFASTRCSPLPTAGCREGGAGSARVSFRRRGHADRNTFQWEWSSASPTPKVDFGNPMTVTSYRLCMYDTAGLLLEASIPAGGTCKGLACWTPRGSGFRYRDPERGRAGLAKIVLTGSKRGRTKINVYAKGESLPLPAMPIAVPARVQLVPGTPGPCWEAIFDAPTRNDPKQFRAESGG